MPSYSNGDQVAGSFADDGVSASDRDAIADYLDARPGSNGSSVTTSQTGWATSDSGSSELLALSQKYGNIPEPWHGGAPASETDAKVIVNTYGNAGGDGAVMAIAGTKDHLVVTADGNDRVSLFSEGDVEVRTGIGNDTVTSASDPGDPSNPLGPRLDVSAGHSTIYAGAGSDYVELYGGGTAVVYMDDTVPGATQYDDFVRIQHGLNTVFAGGGNDTILLKSDAPDPLNPATGANEIHAGLGSDYVYAGSGGGTDTIYADGGNDTVVSGPNSNVVVYGGAGDDTIQLNGSSGLVYADDTAPGALQGSDTIELYSGLNTVYAGGGNDTIRASAGTQNEIHGGDGSDNIYSLGVDTIYGDDGNDTIVAGPGANIVAYGGVGNDAFGIEGTSGTYTFDGGAGSDGVYMYDRTNAEIAAAKGATVAGVTTYTFDSGAQVLKVSSVDGVFGKN